jgi:hypothetical protein
MTITEYIGVGGPVGIVFAFVGFLLNAWLSKRKDDREEIKIERESESGIVETTKQALQMARDEMTAVNLARIDERKEHEERLTRIRREKDEEIEQLRARVEKLVFEVNSVAMENAQLRGFR